MNIKKLSELTATSKETLRLYREKGLLNPKKNPNNKYFDYDINNLVTLLFIKKLRYFNIPLSSIKHLLTNKSTKEIIDQYDEQIKELNLEIRSLQNKINRMKVAKKHLLNSMDLDDKVTEMDFMINRYDIYDENIKNHLADSAIYINSLIIKMDDLLNEEDTCDVHLALGFDENILTNYPLDILEDTMVSPVGHYLCICLEVDNFKTIDKAKLKPIFDYAAEHDYKIVSGATSFLADIQQDNNSTKFYYRFRVKVEKCTQ